MLLAFLDEFGNDGAYISRADPRYCHTPIFGYAGFVIEDTHIRRFSSQIFRLKRTHFNIASKRALSREYKGAKVFHNRIFHEATNADTRYHTKVFGQRLLSALHDSGGKLVFYGLEKFFPPETHNATALHANCMREIIVILHGEAHRQNKQFALIFDHHSNHFERTRMIAREMCKSDAFVKLIEPPLQADSRINLSIQAADWMCALLLKSQTYSCARGPEWPELRGYFDNFNPLITLHAFPGSRMKITRPAAPIPPVSAQP